MVDLTQTVVRHPAVRVTLATPAVGIITSRIHPALRMWTAVFPIGLTRAITIGYAMVTVIADSAGILVRQTSPTTMRLLACLSTAHSSTLRPRM